MAGLRELGAEVCEIPFIEIHPPRSFKSLDDSLKLVGEYQWLILTSVNGVQAIFDRMAQLNIAKHALAGLKIVAIGPATCSAIEREGLKVDITPKEYVTESSSTRFPTEFAANGFYSAAPRSPVT